MVQGGVHDAGVGALVSIRHVHDGQSVCINHKPKRITVLEEYSVWSSSRPPWVARYLSSSGSSPLSLSQVMMGMRVGSCLTLHSKAALMPLWTTLYSGCFRIRVGSNVERKGRAVKTGHRGLSEAQDDILHPPLTSRMTWFSLIPRLLVAMQVYFPLLTSWAAWISSVPFSWITYGSPFLMLVWMSLNLCEHHNNSFSWGSEEMLIRV